MQTPELILSHLGVEDWRREHSSKGWIPIIPSLKGCWHGLAMLAKDIWILEFVVQLELWKVTFPNCSSQTSSRRCRHVCYEILALASQKNWMPIFLASESNLQRWRRTFALLQSKVPPSFVNYCPNPGLGQPSSIPFPPWVVNELFLASPQFVYWQPMIWLGSSWETPGGYAGGSL